jgi:hypothetical protein
VVVPRTPGSLAVGPNGRLYIADDSLQEILERLPTGRFVVVVGTGHAGFSGDGGQATRAEIDQPEGMTFAPNGTLYFADLGNNRVRSVRPNGVIVTMAGNGKDSSQPPLSGTPALQARLGGPAAVAISPSGHLYVVLGNANAVVEITRSTVAVTADAADFAGLDPQYPGADCAPSGLAFDRSGDLYLSCGNFSDVIMRPPNGRFVYRGFLKPHDLYAGLTRGPADSVLGLWVSQLVRLTRTKRSTLHAFDLVRHVGPFWPTGVALGRDGTIYLDQHGYGGVGPPAIVALSPKGKVTVLWPLGTGNDT